MSWVTRTEPTGTARALSPVVAVTMLFGLVAITSLGLFAAGGQLLADSSAELEDERVSEAFVQLGRTMGTATTDSEATRVTAFEAGEFGAVTKTDAGWIAIEGGDIDLTGADRLSIGAIEYESDDGTVIAYQSGGVWRERGNRTRMLSPPNLNFDIETETLTFPVTTVSGERDLSSGQVRVRHEDTRPVREADIVENDTVTITVKSDYYRGWQTYFERQIGETTVQNVDHANRTVTASLGYEDMERAFESGVGVPSEDNVDGFKDEFEDDVQVAPMRPMDPVIDALLADVENGSADLDRDLSEAGIPDTLGPGTYYIDSITEHEDELDGEDSLDFDLSSGNATLIVRGDVDLAAASIEVTDQADDSALQIYMGGDALTGGGSACVGACGNDGQAKHLQLYGTSDTAVDFSSSDAAEFEGVIYVASNDPDNRVSVNGNKCDNLDADPQVYLQAGGDEVSGAIVAHSICSQSSGHDFAFDDTLANEVIDPYPPGYSHPPQITYLNVAVHEISVTND
ncbi:DUF7289 family protein [Halovivax limisalsi]|uniref:DUF7289 family protein n=1 Tax=Halovivax limisalsi TaxID=1453760 RepID=UPI001FFDD4E0|nr:hypothetical protein [Halovivax limisalsi]